MRQSENLSPLLCPVKDVRELPDTVSPQACHDGRGVCVLEKNSREGAWIRKAQPLEGAITPVGIYLMKSLILVRKGSVCGEEGTTQGDLGKKAQARPLRVVVVMCSEFQQRSVGKNTVRC